MDLENKSLGELRALFLKQLAEGAKRVQRLEEEMRDAQQEVRETEEKLRHLLALFPGSREPEGWEEEVGPSVRPTAPAEARTEQEVAGDIIRSFVPDMNRPYVAREIQEYVKKRGLEANKGTIHRALQALVEEGVLMKKKARPGTRSRFAYAPR